MIIDNHYFVDYSFDNTKQYATKNYIIINFDWKTSSKNFKEAIMKCQGCESDPDNSITVCLLMPLIAGHPNVDCCYLHISTIGVLNIEDIVDFIDNNLKNNLSLLDTSVVLTPREKIEILSNLIPSKDYRERW